MSRSGGNGSTTLACGCPSRPIVTSAQYRAFCMICSAAATTFVRSAVRAGGACVAASLGRQNRPSAASTPARLNTPLLAESPSSLEILMNAEDVALGIIEPGCLLRTKNTDLVDGLEVGQVIVLEHNAALA